MMYYLLFLAVILSASCQHQTAAPQEKGEEFTLGVVQQRIQVGMSQPDVAQALGMPNIVTKDAHGKEAWIYDRMASEVSYSHESGGVWLIIAGFGKQTGAAKTSQRTLTVVIKFNDSGLVQDVTYHSSQF